MNISADLTSLDEPQRRARTATQCRILRTRQQYERLARIGHPIPALLDLATMLELSLR
jgi:hypothetical protein